MSALTSQCELNMDMSILNTKGGESYKVPMINWAHTPLFDFFVENRNGSLNLVDNQ
jgi:hypothetical protein